jgi:flagellin-like hook-associated protein FlgL
LKTLTYHYRTLPLFEQSNLDAEYTIETSKLAKQQILANASAAMLAQANIAKQSTLMLLEY